MTNEEGEMSGHALHDEIPLVQLEGIPNNAQAVVKENERSEQRGQAQEADREAEGGTCTGDSSEGKVSRHEGSFINIEQHVGSLKKEGLGRAFFEGESVQQEVNAKVTETTAMHARGQQEVFVLSEDDMATLHNEVEVELSACGGEGIIITENKEDAGIDQLAWQRPFVEEGDGRPCKGVTKLMTKIGGNGRGINRKGEFSNREAEARIRTSDSRANLAE
ncbi:hypothetical protein VNO80_30310 [Phaseolus coccineus]|uniref:Uncharacterized protein n=1 Tax=Phaseolus coccineus TaxID=3886 RepID=A0AAN9LCI6_PHACN